MNSSAAPVLSAPAGESSETYPRIVARLNDRLRVIEGRCGLQWCVQYRKAPNKWESFAFCGTREGLLLRIRDHLQQAFHKHERDLIPLAKLVELHCDPAAWAIIEALPDYYPK
jgi:hypothetical protein